MSPIEILGSVLLYVGALFFLAGTVGLLRFPDVYTRLHALAKVDNLGLGFMVLGLMTRVDNAATAVKLVLVWLLALFASATLSYLIARRALAHGIVPVGGNAAGEARRD